MGFYMDKIRVRYSKTGKAKYISHLDLMETMKRAFIRAGVALKYSEGFNPHAHISVALPLSVGMDSICELMDVSLAGGSINCEVNKFLPEGLEIQKAYRPWRKFSDIKWVETECRLVFADRPAEETINKLTELFSAKNLFITKKTKRGISTIDIAPHICDAAVSRDKEDAACIQVNMNISAQNPTVSSKDIISIIESENDNIITQISGVLMKRIDIYDVNMVLFK